MSRLDKIRWHIGGKKPVEWDLTKLKTISLSLIGPVEVSWITRNIFTDQVTEHLAMMYWEREELYELVPQAKALACAPLLILGQPISVSGIPYRVKMLEVFTLPPSRIFSPWEGMIGFSYTGWAGFRYLVE